MDRVTLIMYTLILFIFGGLLWNLVYRLYERWEWNRIKRSLNKDSQ